MRLKIFGLANSYSYCQFFLCFILNLTGKVQALGACIWTGDLSEGFLRYEFGGLILGRAYTWRGLFLEFHGTFGLILINVCHLKCLYLA